MPGCAVAVSASLRASNPRQTKRKTGRRSKLPNLPEVQKPARSITAAYSTDERKAAVAAALSVSREHPLSYASMMAVQAVLGRNVAVATMHSWLALYRAEIEPMLPNAPSLDSLVADTRERLTRNLSQLALQVSEHALEYKTIKDMSGRDSGVVIGIATDKIQQLTGLSPAVNMKAQQLERTCMMFGVDVLQVIDDIIASMMEAHQTTTIDSTAQDTP